MHSLLQDLRFSVRQLIKSPGFTFTAIVSLALGIGATAAVFSVIYAALLNPFPYPNADRIVRLRIFSKESGGRGFNPNGPQVRELQKISRHFLFATYERWKEMSPKAQKFKSWLVVVNWRRQ